jgi:hypothetical protein
LFLGINSFQALYFATNGDNTVYKGGNGNDSMHVVSGTAYGGSGDDRLFVNGSTAYGGDGDDYLFNDFNGIHVGGYLNGGKGNDILKVNNFSASEKATFSFSEDHDTYIGFQQGMNKIDLTYIGAQFSDLSFNGNIIEFNGHTATVEDFSGTFIEEDFIF